MTNPIRAFVRRWLGLALLTVFNALGTAHAQTATTTTLSANINPSSAAQYFVLTASVSPATATGAITFKDGATTLGTMALSNGKATWRTSFTAAGTRTCATCVTTRPTASPAPPTTKPPPSPVRCWP